MENNEQYRDRLPANSEGAGILSHLRLVFGYLGVALLIVGATLSGWLFWKVAENMVNTDRAGKLVDDYERMMITKVFRQSELRPEAPVPAVFPPTEPSGTREIMAPDTVDESRTASEFRRFIRSEDVEAILKPIQDFGIHRLFSIFILFLLISLLARLSLGILAAGSKIAEITLGSGRKNAGDSAS